MHQRHLAGVSITFVAVAPSGRTCWQGWKWWLLMEMYNSSLRTSTPSPPYAHPKLSTLLQEHMAAGKFSENVKKIPK